jgi:hypothetical protein
VQTILETFKSDFHDFLKHAVTEFIDDSKQVLLAKAREGEKLTYENTLVFDAASTTEVPESEFTLAVLAVGKLVETISQTILDEGIILRCRAQIHRPERKIVLSFRATFTENGNDSTTPFSVYYLW